MSDTNFAAGLLATRSLDRAISQNAVIKASS
jgi:hypothetical protein